REVTLTLAGATFAGDLVGEQSTAAALWNPLGGITPTDPTDVTVVLPAQSVTSLSAPLGPATGSPAHRPAPGIPPSCVGLAPAIPPSGVGLAPAIPPDTGTGFAAGRSQAPAALPSVLPSDTSTIRGPDAQAVGRELPPVSDGTRSPTHAGLAARTSGEADGLS